MKKIEKDRNLELLMKDYKPESPGNDFTSRVMNRVHEIAIESFKFAKEKIMGRRFWIITTLFFVIALSYFVLTYFGIIEGAEANSILPSVEETQVGNSYQSFLQKLNSVPASVTAILIASSILIFLERYLSAKRIKAKK